MNLKPNKTKFNKAHKGRIGGKTTNNNKLAFGSFGMRTKGPCRIFNFQIEAARRVLMRNLRRKIDKIWIKVFPHIPTTCKSANSRMGKGKGSVKNWMCRVQQNEIIFELTALSSEHAYKACKSASNKLPCQLEFLIK